MHLERVKEESERLAGWSSRWFRLANDKARMQRMGGLQQQQDRILARANIAMGLRRRLLHQWWAYMESDEYKKASGDQKMAT